MRITTFLLAAGLCGGAAAATSLAPVFKTLAPIHIGGEARWDYVQIDSPAHRLYVSHGTQTEVIDTESSQLLGTIPDTAGVHGIAIASDLGQGYTRNGKDNSVTVFDLATLKVKGKIKVGENPDAILYDPSHQLLLTFNGKSEDLTVVDAKRGEVIKTVAVKGKPEFAQIGFGGKIIFNIEDSNELASFDPVSLALTQRIALKGCEEPTGLAVDEQFRSYSVCKNKRMVIVAPDGKQQTVKIGAGADGAAWLDGLALSSNGADGTISVVRETSAGHFDSVDTLATAYGARTIVADPATHRLYLPTADFEPAQAQAKRKSKPNTFRVLVLERQ